MQTEAAQTVGHLQTVRCERELGLLVRIHIQRACIAVDFNFNAAIRRIDIENFLFVVAAEEGKRTKQSGHFREQ